MSDFAPYTTDKVSFIIKNTTTDRNKTISVFGCSILDNQTKDLMALPGISPLTAGASVPAATLTTWSNFTSSPFNSRVMHYGNGTKMVGL